MFQKLNASPPRLQITVKDEGLQDSKSDSHVLSTAKPLFRRSRSETGGISSIALPQRRRGSAEDPHELKITAALNNSGERKKIPTIPPASTPPSEVESDSSSEEEISDKDTITPTSNNHFRAILNELLECYGGNESPEAKLLLTTLSIGREVDFKEKEQAYSFLQSKINELRGDALLISVSINSALINHLLKSLEKKKSVAKDYDSIVLVIRDGVSAEAIKHSLIKLMSTTFSSDGFIVVHHPTQAQLVTNLENQFNLEFEKKEQYGFFDLKDCVLSKINAITNGATKILILADDKYEGQLQVALRKDNQKEYKSSKFKTLSSVLNQDLRSDELLASQVSERILHPIAKLIQGCQNSGTDRILS